MLDFYGEMVYNVLVMNEIITCYDIELETAEKITETHTVNVYLKEGDSVLNDWRAIKKALEVVMGKRVYTFSYKYAN